MILKTLFSYFDYNQVYYVILIAYSLNVQEWKSTLLGVILGIIRFGVEIHAQNSDIHSQKSDSNHYFGVDSTIYNLGMDSTPNEVIPNMTSKRVDFHSTAIKRVCLSL